jgi:hypothetical protein
MLGAMSQGDSLVGKHATKRLSEHCITPWLRPLALLFMNCSKQYSPAESSSPTP